MWAGYKRYNALLKKGEKHPIEKTGAKLRQYHSITEPSRAMLRKFPQMFLAKFDNNRNLISIICEPYLGKTIFTLVPINRPASSGR